MGRFDGLDNRALLLVALVFAVSYIGIPFAMIFAFGILFGPIPLTFATWLAALFLYLIFRKG